MSRSSVQQALASARSRFAQSSSAAADAEILLCSVLGKPRAWLYAHGEELLGEQQLSAFAALVERRHAGEPVAHILGYAGFWSLQLAVTPDTLIPRPETELLVELALELVPDAAPMRILDLGTGTGAVALAIARERPRASITATDVDARTLAVAAANAGALRIPGVRFLCGDWFGAVPAERFELIVSNPPYIANDDPHLQSGDLRFEPPGALSSGPDGLDAIRRIAAQSRNHLHPGGWLLLEHGWQQGAAVSAILRDVGLVMVRTCNDLEQRGRVTLARRGEDG